MADAYDDYKWYTKRKKKGLDYSKPILCITKRENNNSMTVLMPCLTKDGSYKVVGYNWFNMKEGCWHSCRFWFSPEDAVNSRIDDECIVVNGTINLKTDAL